MSNVVQLKQPSRRTVPVSWADQPADAQAERHLQALRELQRLCGAAIAAGGLTSSALVESDLLIGVIDAFKGTSWNVRFERKPDVEV